MPTFAILSGSSSSHFFSPPSPPPAVLLFLPFPIFLFLHKKKLCDCIVSMECFTFLLGTLFLIFFRLLIPLPHATTRESTVPSCMHICNTYTHKNDLRRRHNDLTRAGVVMDTDSEETAAPSLSLFDSFSVPVVTTSQINQVRGSLSLCLLAPSLCEGMHETIGD